MTKFISDEFISNGIKVNVEQGFEYYSNQSKEFQHEFIVFLSRTINSTEPIKILEVETSDKIVLQVTRKKGEICTYAIEVLVDNECINKTEVSHDGYGSLV